MTGVTRLFNIVAELTQNHISGNGARAGRFCQTNNTLHPVIALFTVLVIGLSDLAAAETKQPGYTEESFLIERGITTRDGLPANGVTDLIQDSRGYIWASTYNGLVRYDGESFKEYNVSTVEGLDGNRFISVHEDPEGNIWAGQENNTVIAIRPDTVEVFEIDYEKFGYNVQVAELMNYSEKDDAIWVGTTSGLFLLEAGRFEYIDHFPNSVVETLVQDGEWIFVQFQQMLYQYHHEQNEVRKTAWIEDGNIITPNYRISGKEIFDSISFRMSDLLVRDSALWLLTNAGMVKIYEEEYQPVFRHHDISLRFSHTFEFIDKKLLVAGTKGVISIEGVLDDKLHSTQITDNYTINKVLVDHEGSIWIATQANGIRQFVSTPINTEAEFEDLQETAVTAVIEDHNQHLWVATNCDGVYRFAGKETHHYAEHEMYNTCIWSVLETSKGTIWFGSWGGGLYRFNPELQGSDVDSFQEFRPELLIDEYDFNAVLALHEDEQGRIWVGSYDGGLLRINGDEITPVPDKNGSQVSAVRGFYEKSKGTLWVATDNGIGYVEEDRLIKPEKFDVLSTNNFRTINKGPDGRLWFGSNGGGLAIYESNEEPVRLTAEQGLDDETISQLWFDRDGNLWLAGNKGIFYVDREQYKAFLADEIEEVRTIRLSEDEGMPVRETTGGFHPSSHMTDNGILNIPTVRGIVEVHTGKMRLNTEPPQVYIEEVRVESQMFKPDEIDILKHDARDIVIRFSALSFMNPNRNQYKYKLEGFHDHWHVPGDNREVIFSSLPPGEYTFKVQAANNHGYWNEEGASIAFTVSPPFWQTYPFYMFMSLIIGGGLYGLVRYRIRWLKLREEELNRIVVEQTHTIRREKERAENRRAIIEKQTSKLKELDEVKSRFFANISHELRTPLTIIKGVVRQVLNGHYGEIPESIARKINEVEVNADRLTNQIDQLLELSRLETGKVEINLEVYDISAQIHSLYSMFYSMAEAKKIDFKLRSPSKEVWINSDQEKTEHIISNLISNALKYTGEYGEVIIQLTEHSSNVSADKLSISVSDNGAGIPEEYKKHIFDRFRQGPQTGEQGTGLGLALVKEWTEMLGGEVQLQSQSSLGTTIMVELPGNMEGLSIPREVTFGKPKPIPINISEKPGSEEEESEEFREEKKTILVVEDHSELRGYLRDVLSDRFNVKTTANGKDGLTVAKSILPDIIITDVMMPEMDGYEFCRNLKKDPEVNFIPVIMLTARADEKDELAGLEKGADAYITKPFNEEKLLKTVHNQIDSRTRLWQKFNEEQIISKLLPRSEGDNLLSELNKKIDEKLNDPELKIEDIARSLHITQRQLQRKIKDETGLTPKKYLIKRRLKAARSLLLNGAGSISEVGYAVGFNNLSLFSGYFRDEYGKLPSEYIKSR